MAESPRMLIAGFILIAVGFLCLLVHPFSGYLNGANYGICCSLGIIIGVILSIIGIFK
jgi:hypothetical protein